MIYLRRPEGAFEWRVVLRLGWATLNDFYVPVGPDGKPRSTIIFPESLPRCLSIRVAGRSVSLPDPIFHGGQAQKLGKRLRLSIDITDKVRMNNLLVFDFNLLQVESFCVFLDGRTV